MPLLLAVASPGDAVAAPEVRVGTRAVRFGQGVAVVKQTVGGRLESRSNDDGPPEFKRFCEPGGSMACYTFVRDELIAIEITTDDGGPLAAAEAYSTLLDGMRQIVSAVIDESSYHEVWEHPSREVAALVSVSAGGSIYSHLTVAWRAGIAKARTIKGDYLADLESPPGLNVRIVHPEPVGAVKLGGRRLAGTTSLGILSIDGSGSHWFLPWEAATTSKPSWQILTHANLPGPDAKFVSVGDVLVGQSKGRPIATWTWDGKALSAGSPALPKSGHPDWCDVVPQAAGRFLVLRPEKCLGPLGNLYYAVYDDGTIDPKPSALQKSAIVDTPKLADDKWTFVPAEQAVFAGLDRAVSESSRTQPADKKARRLAVDLVLNQDIFGKKPPILHAAAGVIVVGAGDDLAVGTMDADGDPVWRYFRFPNQLRGQSIQVVEEKLLTVKAVGDALHIGDAKEIKPGRARSVRLPAGAQDNPHSRFDQLACNADRALVRDATYGQVAARERGGPWTVIARGSEPHWLLSDGQVSTRFTGSELEISTDLRQWRRSPQVSQGFDFRRAQSLHSGDGLILISAPDSIVRSKDGGASWLDGNVGKPKGSADAIVSRHARVAYVGVKAVNVNPQFAKSEDGGRSWTEVGADFSGACSPYWATPDLLTEIAPRTLLTRSGLSRDEGRTWQCPAGLKEIHQELTAALFWPDAKAVLLATKGRGMYIFELDAPGGGRVSPVPGTAGLTFRTLCRGGDVAVAGLDGGLAAISLATVAGRSELCVDRERKGGVDRLGCAPLLVKPASGAVTAQVATPPARPATADAPPASCAPGAIAGRWLANYLPPAPAGWNDYRNEIVFAADGTGRSMERHRSDPGKWLESELRVEATQLDDVCRYTVAGRIVRASPRPDVFCEVSYTLEPAADGRLVGTVADPRQGGQCRAGVELVGQ